MIMADEGGPSAAVRAPAGPGPVRFVRLPGAALAALADGNLARASELSGVTLTGYFITPDAVRLWRLRRDQIAADPASARWIARAVVTGGAVVGHAGFHGPPDTGGMVEVAYSVDPAHRRRGYATAMLGGLLRRAAAEPGVRTVRATIRPDNTASLGTISGFGFARNGEQWDEEDGLELVFDRSAGWPGAEEAHAQRVPSLRAGQPAVGQPSTGQPGTGPMITTEMIRAAAVLAAGQVAPADDDMVPQVGGALLDAFDEPARFADPGALAGPAGGSAIRVLVAVANGMFGLAAGAGRADIVPGAAAPRVELVRDPGGAGTGVLIWGPAGDVAAAAGGAVLDAGALVSWARQQAFSKIYTDEPGSAAAAVRAASGLEIVLLLDPGIGGGLWVDVDPVAQAPAATLLVEMTLPPGGERMFRVISP
jgi:RimJ/RimL family protein N-acetyltransferase